MVGRLLLILLLLFSVNSLAQEKRTASPYTAFEGEWVLDPEKSSRYFKEVAFPEFTWLIKSDSDTIVFAMGVYCLKVSAMHSSILERTSMILQPNAKSESNQFVAGKDKYNIKSTTTVSNNQLIRKFETTLDLPVGSKDTRRVSGVVEEFTVSKDGNQLTFKTSARFRDAPPEYLATISSVPPIPPVKFVFNRKSSTVEVKKEK